MVTVPVTSRTLRVKTMSSTSDASSQSHSLCAMDVTSGGNPAGPASPRTLFQSASSSPLIGPPSAHDTTRPAENDRPGERALLPCEGQGRMRRKRAPTTQGGPEVRSGLATFGHGVDVLLGRRP